MKPMVGDATLEIKVTARNATDGTFGRSDMYLALGGIEFTTTPTEDQQIWNALPRRIRDLLLAECEESAEPDIDDATCDDARAP